MVHKKIIVEIIYYRIKTKHLKTNETVVNVKSKFFYTQQSFNIDNKNNIIINHKLNTSYHIYGLYHKPYKVIIINK